MREADAVLVALGGHDAWLEDTLRRVTGLKRHDAGLSVFEAVQWVCVGYQGRAARKAYRSLPKISARLSRYRGVVLAVRVQGHCTIGVGRSKAAYGRRNRTPLDAWWFELNDVYTGGPTDGERDERLRGWAAATEAEDRRRLPHQTALALAHIARGIGTWSS